MKEFWKKNKIIIAVAAYSAIVLLFFYFAVSPLIESIKKNSDEIQKIKIDREISQERISKLPEMKNGYATYEQEKDNLDIILDQNNSVDFIKKVELLSEETGNKINLSIADNSNASKNAKDAKTGKKDPESIKDNLPSDKYISMNMTLEGSYENFIKFLYKLENLDYYVNVISFDLSKEAVSEENNGASKTSGKNILISSFEVVVYTK